MTILPKIKLNKKIKIFLISLLFFVFSFSFLPFSLPRANAQFIRTLTITPPTVSLTLSPGERAEGQLKIINDGDLPLSINTETQDYIVVDGSGTPNLLPLNTLSGKYSAASWLGVAPGEAYVEPHQKQVYRYYVQVPEDARPGGHYAAVVYKPAAEKTSGTGTGVNSQMATLFYITIKGDILEKANVSKFLANFFNEYGPVNILSQIKNDGDLHIKPTGTITVSNILGQKSTYKLEEHNVFPGGSVRNYETAVGKKWMFGPYTVKLSGSYGKNNNLPLAASVAFWVFPWKIALLVILVVALIILGIKYMEKNKKGNGKKEEPATQPIETPTAE